MPYKAWSPIVEDKEHLVELDWGDVWGSIKVRVDGVVIKRRLITFGFSVGRVDFSVAGSPAILSGSGVFSTRWELYINKKLVKEG
jgi:hypothetical protein